MLQLFEKIRRNLIEEKQLITIIPEEQSLSLYELRWVCTLVKLLRPRSILELGTKFGRTTINLSKFSPKYCKVITVDINRVNRESLNQFPSYSKIEFIQADSTSLDFSRFSPIDFAFIDANHTYSYVTKDTLNVLESLSSKGFVIWHDYLNSKNGKIQVKKAIDRLGLVIYKVPNTRFAIWSTQLFNEYWEKRYKQLGGFRTVGNRAWSSKEYKFHTAYIQSQISPYLLTGDQVLDFGCGIGRFQPLLLKYYRKYYGADIIQKIKKSDFLLVKGGKIPLVFVDGLFTAFTLQHIVDEYLLNKYFEQFKLLLKYGGSFYLCEQIGNNQITTHYGYKYLKLRTIQDYINLCTKYIGLIEVCKTFNSFLFIRARRYEA